VAFGETLCLHTAPMESSTCKSVNFGVHRRLRVTLVISIPKLFTYVLYFVIVFVLDIIYLVVTQLLVLHSINCWCT
jgi:hypothetical protein